MMRSPGAPCRTIPVEGPGSTTFVGRVTRRLGRIPGSFILKQTRSWLLWGRDDGVRCFEIADFSENVSLHKGSFVP